MFVQRLKELRASKEISQATLADHLGVSQQAVAKWETEKATPDPYMITKISSYFSVTTDYLLGRDEDSLKTSSKSHDPKLNLFFRTAEKLSEEELSEIQDLMQFKISRRKTKSNDTSNG